MKNKEEQKKEQDNIEEQEVEIEQPDQINIDELKEKCKEEIEKYIDIAKRTQAEFENYRRRTAQQLAGMKEDGKIEAVGKLLPCLDLMDKAREMLKDNTEVLMGFDMISKQFKQSLKELGIEKIEVKDKEFDHNTSNAIAMMCNAEKEDGVVLEEVLTGYKLGEKIVRYANVVVNKIS